jgi:hypothetical protein
MNSSFMKIWRTPMLLGTITLFGLLSALLGTSIWYGFAWLAMLLPLGVTGWFILKARQPKN